MTTLFDIAQNWLNQDPDAETHAELTALLTAAKNGDEKEQADYLKEYGCDYLQGFYFSKPLPEEEFAKLLD